MAKEYSYIGDICFYYDTFLSKLLKIVNKFTKEDFVAITNPFSSRVHLISYDMYCKMGKDNVFYRHELCHVWQIKRDGRLRFIVRYILSWIKNGFKYRLISYEQEAFNLQWHSSAYIEVYYKNEIEGNKK